MRSVVVPRAAEDGDCLWGYRQILDTGGCSLRLLREGAPWDFQVLASQSKEQNRAPGRVSGGKMEIVY